MAGKKIVIEPVTRLEGEAKISILLDDKGGVENAFFHVMELRGFEEFCRGRPAEEMPRITPRICGVCPWAHHLASAKATDALFGREPTQTAKNIRELGYMAHYIHSHIAHFFALASPDFLLPEASRSERNVLGVVAKYPEVGLEVIRQRGLAQKIQETIGGKATHPVMGIPGGVSKGLKKDELLDISKMGKGFIKFAEKSLDIFDRLILGNKNLKDLILGDVYRHETYYMALVDKNGKVNLYDGTIRVVDPTGREHSRFVPSEYLSHIGEAVEPWSFLKFPHLKSVGWKGLVDGPASGVYRVNSLARLNVADGMATPKAQVAYEKFFETLGGHPVHNTLAFHWARLVELLYAGERLVELAEDPETAGKDTVNLDGRMNGVGVGVVEAPRGTLFHHYESDGDGILKKVNLIVATGQNNAAMCMGIKKAAQSLIKAGKPADEKLLNMVEMAFRAYDPCLACATHALPGHMPLEVDLISPEGKVVRRVSR